VRVTAACMVVMPVSSFLGFMGHFSVYLGAFVSVVIGLYSVWLFYNGLVQALKANPETSRIVSYVFVALIVVFMLVGFGARKRANEFMKGFNSDGVSELVKDTPEK
jgi:ABC-type multidrug transport system permease subunit